MSPKHANSSFSHPLAPPPQQPLPEKPDGLSILSIDSARSTRSSDSDKIFSMTSPTKTDFSSSQILSLVEALTSAKREIDSQGVRVMHLEDLLRQERKAREDAEERARNLLNRARSTKGASRALADDLVDPISVMDTMSWIKSQNHGVNGSSNDDSSAKGSPDSKSIHLSSATSESGFHDRTTEEIDASTTQLQSRLDSMIHEMDELKHQLESYKRKAEDAEEQRNGLAAMVQRIRNGDLDSPPPTTSKHPARLHTNIETATQTDCGVMPTTNGYARSYPTNESTDFQRISTRNGGGSQELMDLQQAIVSAMGQPSRFKDDRLRQSAPYASMLGVVLIGVGLMTYLNAWQKVER